MTENNKKTEASKKDTQTNKKKKFPKTLAIVAAVVLVLGALSVLAYENKEYFVVARVNGEFITSPKLGKTLFTTYGQSALDELITKKLISQKLAEEGIEVTQEDIQTKKDEVSRQLQEQQGVSLENYLELQGVTEKEFMENIRTQVGIEKLFVDDVDVTDEEIQEFLDQYGDQLGEEDEEAKKKRAVDVLVNQEINSLFQKWIQDIRNEAKIENYLE